MALPNTYIELEYIQSNGNQYINTNKAPSTTGKIEMVFMPMLASTRQIMLGSWYSSSSYSYFVQQKVDNTLEYGVTGCTSTDPQTFTFSAGTKYTYIWDNVVNKELTINGIREIGITGTPSSSYELYVFASHDSESNPFKNATMRLYSLKFYDTSGNLVQDYVPAMRLSDRAVGLYEQVSDTFKTRLGSGTFTYAIKCDVSTQDNPNGSGTITGGGEYLNGDFVTITATENNGYAFVDIHRTEEEHPLIKGYVYDGSNLMVYGASRNYTQVTFAEPTIITKYQGNNATDNNARSWDMTIKGSNDNTNYVTIQTNGMNATGTMYIDVANTTAYKYYRWYFSRYNNTYSTGRYIFNNFYITGYRNITTTDSPYTFTADWDTDVVANFSALYNVTLSYDNTLGSASYTWNSDYTAIDLSATPNQDVQFLGWYVNSVQISSNPTYVYSVLSDVTIEARFEPIYDVTDSVDGNGAIQYTRGTDQNDVTISVIPDANNHFVKYEVDGVEYTTTPLALHLNANVVVVAFFEEDDRYHISAPTNVPHTSVYLSDNDVFAGTQVTLWARPFPDYNFIKWGDGETTNPRQITITENITLSAEYQRITDTNGIYQYRCFIKDQLDLEDPPKAFLVVDTFDVNVDLLTNATSTISVMEISSNINEGDVLVLYDPKGDFIYNGVITSIEDLAINCSQMQSFYHGNWIYNVSPQDYLEHEIAVLLQNYADGKLYHSTYIDGLVAQRLGGITIDYEGTIVAKLPKEEDEDGNEEMNVKDMEEWIYELYQKYSIIFDFEINFVGTNYVHIKVPGYQKIAIGNNMYAVQDMSPITEIEETNKLVIFSNDKTYRTTYVATKTGIVENPISTANRFNITNTEIVFSDDDASDLVSANLPNTMYNHKLTFTLIIKNFIYEFGDFNLGGELDVYYNDDYYNSVLTGYQITKESNRNITEAIFTCGKVRNALTKMLTMGVLK